MEKNYYVSRSNKLVKELDAKLKFFKLVLYRSFSNAEVNEITNSTLRVFIEMIPGIPYVGGEKNPLTEALIVSSWFESLYKALKNYNKSDDEISQISKAIADEISRYEQLSRNKKGTSVSKQVLNQITVLKPLFRSLIPGPPQKQVQENYMVTYVSGDGSVHESQNNSNRHTVVKLINQSNAVDAFRHTYKINYWNNHFSGLEMIMSDVALNV
jgi:hypothetical protein